MTDIRLMEHVPGRSINLTLSVRGSTALRMIGIEDEVSKNCMGEGRKKNAIITVDKCI